VHAPPSPSLRTAAICMQFYRQQQLRYQQQQNEKLFLFDNIQVLGKKVALCVNTALVRTKVVRSAAFFTPNCIAALNNHHRHIHKNRFCSRLGFHFREDHSTTIIDIYTRTGSAVDWAFTFEKTLAKGKEERKRREKKSR